MLFIGNGAKEKPKEKLCKSTKKQLQKKIKGTEVKRKASKEEPAYTIQQQDGDKVLKSESELKKGKKKK